MIRDSGDRTEFETGAKRDIYDFLRLAATISEKLGRCLKRDCGMQRESDGLFYGLV